MGIPLAAFGFVVGIALITVVLVVTFLFFTLSGIGSYRAYHFSESVTFCGMTATA